ncbi:MAG: tetratricopeptide repeat protein [Planctomycetota bacterium]
MTDPVSTQDARPGSGIRPGHGHPPPQGRRAVQGARFTTAAGVTTTNDKSGRTQPVQGFNFLPHEPGGEHRYAWMARLSQLVLPAIAWGIALVYLLSGGILLVHIGTSIGSSERMFTGILWISLGILLSITGTAMVVMAVRTHASISRLRQAQRLVRDGHEAEAIPQLTQLLADGRLPGVRHITRFLLGKALAATGRANEAKEAWKACVGFWPAWNNLGAVLLEEGRLHQAERAFRYAIQLNPSEPLLYNHLALALQRRDEPVLARQVLELSLKHARSAATRRNLEHLDNGEPIDVEGILPRLRMPYAGWL